MTQEIKQFQRTEDGHLKLMSDEERNLLITDLTARINYGVICLIERVDDFGPIHRNEKLTGFCFDDIGGFHFEVGGGLDIVFPEKIMPYLRQMSSMTEDEREELFQIWKLGKENGSESVTKLLKEILYKAINENYILKLATSFENWIDVMAWFNKKHFDYRGLIEKGLALEATEDMYVVKN